MGKALWLFGANLQKNRALAGAPGRRLAGSPYRIELSSAQETGLLPAYFPALLLWSFPPSGDWVGGIG